jgi:hypothetical protein
MLMGPIIECWVIHMASGKYNGYEGARVSNRGANPKANRPLQYNDHKLGVTPIFVIVITWNPRTVSYPHDRALSVIELGPTLD